MDALTRRKFLTISGVAGAGALAAGATGLGIAQLLDKARTTDAQRNREAKKLVIVTLYGGNDGLNTVVPYADPAYHTARPELAYAPEQVLHLNDTLGFNPAMSGLKRLWDAKQVAVVLGVGYPRPDRSHFRSMDIWQTASPGTPTTSGWVGRWLDGIEASPETAVSFEPVLPPLLAGETRAGACVNVGGIELPPGITPSMVAAIGRSVRGEPEMQARAATAFHDLLYVDHVVRQAELTPNESPYAVPTHLPSTATGGESLLETQLGLVAQCVEAGVPTRVYSVSLGGFDTHADERSAQELLLKKLDGALTAFVDRMAKTSAGQQVAVVVYSEFGRRVRANASDGTDHGSSGPVFVIGSPVVGGLYGEHPSLGDLIDGDLKVTSDFRDVYGTLLASVLQADPARFIDGHRVRTLPLFHTRP